MCGIAGWVDFEGRSFDRTLLDRMTQSLRHRGPDDAGVWSCAIAGLGHTRLSILDLSPNGRQPMASADGRYLIVYNGELYNSPELRRELLDLGVPFRGHSDTEVVVNCYAQWGASAFPRFNGIFAFGVWDQIQHRLILVRDRLGIKPLSYAQSPGGLVFGSEAKALLISEQVERRLNEKVLKEFLYFGVALGRETLFRDVFKVLPGEYLVYDREGLRRQIYWKAEDIPRLDTPYDEAVVSVRTLLDKAVERQLLSDVPLGLFLSGGIDSSCIAAFAVRHYSSRLKTFSVGFDYEKGVNELPEARALASRLGTEHHEIHVSGVDLASVIPRLVIQHDQPFSDAANIPLYLLAERVSGSVKVVLQGDGGDELFAGYRRYCLLQTRRSLRVLGVAARWSGLLRVLHQVQPRLGRIVEAFATADDARCMGSLLTEEVASRGPESLLGPIGQKEIEGTDAFRRYREMNKRFQGSDLVQRMLVTDLHVILPDIFLEKVDRATMAHGVEARVPFLDNELVEYAVGLPSTFKVRGGQKKRILRDALRDTLPPEVLDRPKTGFSVPYGYWLRGPLSGLARDVFASCRPDGVFDRKALEDCLEAHIQGKQESGFRLWKALNFLLWTHAYKVSS